jgi:SH3-like domain-containing protein
LIAAAVLAGVAAHAAVEAQQTPYFARMKSDKVFMREGPSDDNRVKWVYHHKGMPVQVLDSFDVWRRVRDMDGETGWIHMALLSRDRTAVVVGKVDAPVRRRADEDSNAVAEAAPGAIGRLVACRAEACEVKFDGGDGWVDRSHLWGILQGERF